MIFLYNIVIYLTIGILSIAKLFSEKLRLFISGRKQTFQIIRQKITPTDKTIWFHCASLGEFEQGLPIMEAVKKEYPNHKMVVSFFSPSGFENKKNTKVADVVVYLPMDTKKNAKKFIDALHPSLVFFVKYEFWPQYLIELKRQNIKTLLVSGVFREDHVFFKPYGGFMRKALTSFDHFYVQDENSKSLLNSIGLEKCTVSGDTRIDRVSKILDSDNSLDFMDAFNTAENCLIAGSTWPEDEKILVDYINRTPSDMKFVIAPHNIKKEHSRELKKSIDKPTLLYSEIECQSLENIHVLIIDTIGILTKLYSYATIAYVGGGFATGLHNTAEPAVFGIPVVIGPAFKGFKEAEELVLLGGVISIHTKTELTQYIDKMQSNKDFRNKVGRINAAYINENKGASTKIMEGVSKLL